MNAVFNAYMHNMSFKRCQLSIATQEIYANG